jgi:hypothetical protein
MSELLGEGDGREEAGRFGLRIGSRYVGQRASSHARAHGHAAKLGAGEPGSHATGISTLSIIISLLFTYEHRDCCYVPT